MENCYKIYTDGSCSNNGKKNAKAGIGVYFQNVEISDISEEFTTKPITNQRAEIMACIKALDTLINNDLFDNSRYIIIYTDSKYTINCITKWINKWNENGWQTTNKKPVKNADLLKQLHKLYIDNKVIFQHVKAHQKEPLKTRINEYTHWYGNNKADKLAELV